MELKCPSCGISHESNNYPGAFEINCNCGYAILIPDENIAVSAALENEDGVIAVPLPAEEIAPLELTPPDQLPHEMAYDSFELQPPEELVPQQAAPKLSPKAAPHSGQLLVERSVMATLGQMLGISYELKISGLDSEATQHLFDRAKNLLATRPWLANALRERGVSLNKPQMPLSLSNVPEILALELYLATFELGGSCEFAKVIATP
jgi:hypothetical protein